MKTFRLIGMALVAMCLCMNFASCSNEDVLSPEDPQEEKYVTVGLGCTGEFLEFSDSPLSRNTDEELYGIQVYALTENGGYSSTPYAYGMFTSLDDVKIRLLKEQKYKFEVSVVINPFKKECDEWFGYYYSKYFEIYNTEFAYSASFTINCDYVRDNYNGGEKWKQYDYDRYYGMLDLYVPDENGYVEINTKRVTYGVKYETMGLNSEESVKIQVLNGNKNLYDVVLGSESNESIYTFSTIAKVWDAACNGPKDYTSDKKLTITWNKADGTSVPMGTYNVTFKRNVMTTIRIKAENLNMDNGIKVFKEEVAMVPDDNVYEIEGGTVTEVPVISGN